MVTALAAWGISAAVMLLLAAWLGAAIRRGFFGILIDDRGRYSLSRLQLVLWTLVALSLIAGVFITRLLDGSPENALEFTIPGELLAVLGISAGSTVTSTVIKTNENNENPRKVAASDASDPPRFSQVFLIEEGTAADAYIDVAKFQNFWFTLILVVAYVAIAVGGILAVDSADELGALPSFPEGFLILLGISHAAYLSGKLPTPPGDARGRQLLDLQVLSEKQRLEQLEQQDFTPRNQRGADRTRRRLAAAQQPARPPAGSG